MRRIAAVTVARSDYGICRPIYRRILQTPGLSLKLIVTGAHISPRYGYTIDEIRRDDMPIAATVDTHEDDDATVAITRSLGNQIAQLGQVYADLKPDLLLVLGDRLEMAGAVLAAQPANIPVAHIHGGEVSLGAIDDALRHAITQMSALHFVSHADHARRVIQLGQQPDRVIVSGAPALDNLREMNLLSRHAIAQQHQLQLPESYALVVFHPVTRQPGQALQQVNTLLEAMRQTGLPCVIGYPNADAGNHAIIEAIETFVKHDPRSRVFRNMGIETYFSLMHHARVMVGNSSSGIIEAASLKLPVVNVGDRQKGRLHGENVIDVPCESAAIVAGVKQAGANAFREQVAKMLNPYGDGQASQRIVDCLQRVELGPGLLQRPFHDLPA